MFALISYKNNQYRVIPGREYEIDLIDSEDKKIVFSEVLFYSDGDDNRVGTPILNGATVEAEVMGTVRSDKVSAIKFKSKKRYKRNLGHKQDYTKIKILNINIKNEK